jgi:prephenate dehydrogenase
VKVIAIVGLGFIGGSIGLTLRKSAEAIEIVGHDRDPSQARRARRLGAVHRAEWNLIHACDGADVVILALPPEAIRDTLEAVAADLQPGCLVTDTATIKGEVLGWAEELLPGHAAFVGGDPVVQTPGLGLDSASADVFQGALYCLTPGTNVPPRFVEDAVDLVRLLGAEPFFLDAEEHDGLRAAVDHLPTLLAAVLLREVSRSPSSTEMERLMGPVLAQASASVREQATTYPSLCLYNAAAISHWSRVMRDGLEELERLVTSRDQEKLAALFQEVVEAEGTELRARLPETGLWRQWLGLADRGTGRTPEAGAGTP